MCGIAGVIWKNGEDRSLVVAMTRRLGHRGPDDEQFWFASELGLGFRRLSIIDPAGGHQPVSNEDQTVVAVCNGEIYNHVAQRRRLEPRGHRFHSGSDAEVIPHLYEEHGPDFVAALHGKFAVALYDTGRRRLVLARDCLGIKPLYYLETPSGFWFGSELKSLLLAPDYTPTVDRDALDLLLAFKHIPGDATLLAGVRYLRPGTRLVYDVATHTYGCETFYRIPEAPEQVGGGGGGSVGGDTGIGTGGGGNTGAGAGAGVAAGLDEAAAEVRRRFDAAVLTRLMSDVPLAVALSGGLDSSAVVAAVARQADRPPTTFSVYTGDRLNELPFARLVADRYKTDHHEIVVQPDELDAVIPQVLWHIEEPMSISELPTYYLGRAVGGRMKVLLCGEGADELFGGYKRFLPLNLAPWLPKPILKWGYIRGINGLTRRDRERLYSPAQQPHQSGNSNPWLDDAVDRGRGSVLNRFLRYELSQQLRSQVMRLDKLTMAHGVEARCPFLDPGLVDYVANLPAALKVRGLREKVLLKAAMAERLPAAVIERRKFGMSNPVTTLFGSGFRDLCRQELLANRDVLAPYFDMIAVDKLFDDIGRSPLWLRIPEQQLFHVYLFLKWHRIFIDGQVPAQLAAGDANLDAAAASASGKDGLG